MVQNLLQNAVKYCDAERPTIEIDSVGDCELTIFRVRDNGPGIEPQYQERIFDPFEKLQSRDEIEGTGVGLALVKGMVEEEGGTVWVDSQSGEGATFCFSAYRF